MKHFLTLNDYSKEEILDLIKLACKLKEERKEKKEHHILKGKKLGMIFAKSSTRTRVSFEAGMYELGGHAMFLSSNDIQLGRGEPISDTAGVLSRYLDGIMIRTFLHDDILELAKYSSIPVINGLTDLLHPCQILADIMTVYEHKNTFENLKIAYIGDGNNVANSLLYGCSKLGINIAVASPEGFTCDETVVRNSIENTKKSNSKIILTNDPVEAIKEADAVYTDTWVSMGQEEQKQEKVKIFKNYQVNKELFKYAKEDALFLHCLPAYRGFEVTSDIIDGQNSVIFDEAENRLHVQKAVMTTLMG